MTDSKALEAAEKVVGKLGLPLPDKPEVVDHAMQLPNNVADLSLEDLAEHLTWWTQWASYTRYQLAKIETNEEARSEAYSIEEKIRMHRSEGDYKNVTELKAAVAQTPDMQKSKKLLLEVRATKKLVRALLIGYEAKYATVSREISRRGIEFGNEGEKRDVYRVPRGS